MKPYVICESREGRVLLEEFGLHKKNKTILRGITKKYEAKIYIDYNGESMGRRACLEVTSKSQKAAFRSLRTLSETLLQAGAKRFNERFIRVPKTKDLILEFLGLDKIFPCFVTKKPEFNMRTQGNQGIVHDMGQGVVNWPEGEIPRGLSHLDEREKDVGISLIYQEKAKDLFKRAKFLEEEIDREQSGEITKENSDQLTKVKSMIAFLERFEEEYLEDLQNLKGFEEEFLSGDMANKKLALKKEANLKFLFEKFKAMEEALKELEAVFNENSF